jgi:hypothetical protein
VKYSFDFGQDAWLFDAATRCTPAFSRQLPENLPGFSQVTLSLRSVVRFLTGQRRCFVHNFILSRTV